VIASLSLYTTGAQDILYCLSVSKNRERGEGGEGRMRKKRVMMDDASSISFRRSFTPCVYGIIRRILKKI
jgi:hypothetical protein